MSKKGKRKEEKGRQGKGERGTVGLTRIPQINTSLPIFIRACSSIWLFITILLVSPCSYSPFNNSWFRFPLLSILLRGTHQSVMSTNTKPI